MLPRLASGFDNKVVYSEKNPFLNFDNLSNLIPVSFSASISNNILLSQNFFGKSNPMAKKNDGGILPIKNIAENH